MNNQQTRRSPSLRHFPMDFLTRWLITTCWAVLACGCAVMPAGLGRYTKTDYYSAVPLTQVSEEQVLYLVEECTKEGPDDSCKTRNLAQTVWLAKTGWLAEHTPNAPAGAQKIYSLQTYPSHPQYFEKPSFASKDADLVFLGILTDEGDQTILWSKNTEIFYAKAPNDVAPALVVPDGKSVYLFAERAGGCPAEQCFTVAEVLGVKPDSLPKAFQHYFMVFAADTDSLTSLNRLVRSETTRALPGPRLASGNGSWFVPKPVTDDVLTFSGSEMGRMQFTKAFNPTSYCEYAVMDNRADLIFPLTGSGYHLGDRTERFNKCDKVSPVSGDLVNAKLIPAPWPPTKTMHRTDPVPSVADVPSSYQCWSTAVTGQQRVGSGNKGCYFVLRDFMTGRPLPNTPYLVSLFEGNTSTKRFEFKGVTDSMGRTAFVRSDEPIISDRLRVSRRLVSAKDFSVPNNSEAKAKRGQDSPVSAEGTRLVRPTDGGVIAKVLYRITTCSGETFEGYTDTQGWTVAVDQAFHKNCPVNFQFLM